MNLRYIDPEVARAASEAGIDYPDPNSEEFEQRIIELTEEGSPWADRLINGVIYKGMGDARENIRVQNARHNRWQAIKHRLGSKVDPDTGEHTPHKGKRFAIIMALALPLIAALIVLPRLLGDSEPAVQAQEVTVDSTDALGTPDTSTSVVPESASTPAGSGILDQVRDFGVALDQRLSRDSDLVGVTADGEVVSEEATADAQPGGAAAEEPGDAYAGDEEYVETLPVLTGVVGQRPSAATPAVVSQRVAPLPQTTAQRPALKSSVVSVSASRPMPAATGANSTNGASPAAGLSSGVVSTRQDAVGAPTVQTEPEPAPSEPQNATAQQEPVPSEPSTQEAETAAPSSDSTPRVELPFRSGDELDGVLELGIIATEGSVVPVVVRTSEGLWQGDASLNAVGRVEIAFSAAIVEGESRPVSAQAVGPDSYLGVEADIRQETPALAADLVTAGLRGVTDYVSELADARSVVDTGDQVIVNDQVVPLEWALAGSLAELFTPPGTESATVRVAEVAKGTSLLVRVF